MTTYDDKTAKVLKGLPFPMHVEQAYDRNMKPHKLHLILDDEVIAGKLKRQKGDALCKPFKRFYKLQTLIKTKAKIGGICADCMKQAKRLGEYELVEVTDNPEKMPIMNPEKMPIGNPGEIELTDDQRARLVRPGYILRELQTSGKYGNAILTVRGSTKKTITTYIAGSQSPRFQGKKYVYKWDGVGFKRQGEYLLYPPNEDNPTPIPHDEMRKVTTAVFRKNMKELGYNLGKPDFIEGGVREKDYIWLSGKKQVTGVMHMSSQANEAGRYKTKITYFLNENALPESAKKPKKTKVKPPKKRTKGKPPGEVPRKPAKKPAKHKPGDASKMIGRSIGAFKRLLKENKLSLSKPTNKQTDEFSEYERWYDPKSGHLIAVREKRTSPKPGQPKTEYLFNRDYMDKPSKKDYWQKPKKPAKKPAKDPKAPKKRRKRKPKIRGLGGDALRKKYGKQLTGQKVKYKTAEDWYHAVVKGFMPLFKKAGVKVPDFDISSGFTAAGTRKTRTLGQAFFKVKRAGMTKGHIFLNPIAVEPLTLINTVIHEVVHLIAGPEAGHKGEFRRICLAVGMVDPMKYTTWDPGYGEAYALKVAHEVGELPREKLDSSFYKKQRARLLKVWCSECGYIMRISRGWIETKTPHCPLGHGIMIVDG